MKNKEIKAIHEQDLDTFLKKLELLKPLTDGNLKCSLCDTTINKENFKFLYSENGEIKACCNKIECYEKIISKIE